MSSVGDLLIRGMEMPTNKFGRVLLIYPNGEVVVGEDTKYEAIPVPPHGDLIDIDKALKSLPENYSKDDLEPVIIRAPAIIPANNV